MDKFEYLKNANKKEFAEYFCFYNSDYNCYEGIDGTFHVTKEQCLNSNINWLSCSV